MELRLNTSANSVKPKGKMAAMALGFGVLAAIIGQLGILMIPLISAPLALILVLERGGKRIFSIAVPIALVFVDALFNGIYSFSCLCAVGVAFLIYLSAARGIFSKGDSAVACVILVSVFAFLAVILYGCLMIDSLDFSASLEYYRNLVDTMRAEWIAVFEQYALSGADMAEYGLTPEALSTMYDTYILSLYSMLVIAAFIAVGLGYKLFTSLLMPYMVKRSELYGWRFALSPIYALAYLILLVLSLFGDGKDTYSVIVANLSNVFMVMLAYLGFMLADAYFRMKSNGRRGGKLIVILAILLFGSPAMLVLSFLGVFASFMIGRAANGAPGAKNNGQGGNDAR